MTVINSSGEQGEVIQVVIWLEVWLADKCLFDANWLVLLIAGVSHSVTVHSVFSSLSNSKLLFRFSSSDWWFSDWNFTCYFQWLKPNSPFHPEYFTCKIGWMLLELEPSVRDFLQYLILSSYIHGKRSALTFSFHCFLQNPEEHVVKKDKCDLKIL